MRYDVEDLGYSVTLTRNSDGRSVFLQGDDAFRFLEDYEKAEGVMMADGEYCQDVLCDDYYEVME